MMDQKQLAAFYYTVILGSTVNAAKKLEVTPSYITKFIQNLEEEVGHKLFSKKGKNLVLIPKGEMFLQTVKTIFAEYENCLAQINRMDKKLALSLPSFINKAWFLEEITPFIKDHPTLSFEIKTLAEVPNFNEEKIDIDIRPLSSPDENTIAKYLMTYDIGLYVSKSYLQEKGPIDHPSDLESHCLISFDKDYLFPYAPANWPFDQSVSIERTLVVDCLMGIAHAIENGLGIGPLPQTVTSRRQEPLIPILPELNYSFDIYYTYPKYLSESLVVNELYKYLRAQPDGSFKGRIKK